MQSGSKYPDFALMGRPAKYDSPEELQEAIDKYFSEGVKKRPVLVGKGKDSQMVEIPVPTITGLCNYLGFDSRQSFYDYENRDGFSYTIKRARLFIEQEYEEQLAVGGGAGPIFALKNFGWKDKQEVENTHDFKNKPTIILDFGNEEDKGN